MPQFNGTNGNDIFTGGSTDDTIVGNGGNDTLGGGGGNDTVAGGSGADTVDGGDGSDFLYSFDVSPYYNRPYYGNPWTPPLMDTGTEVDTVTGGAGDDLIFAGYGDNVDGGDGFDGLVISFLGATSGVTADFSQLIGGGSISIGGGTIQSIAYIEWVEGSNFGDTIIMGDDSANFTPVFGMGGNDHIIAGYYTGDIHGGDGDDIIDRGDSPYGFQHFGEAGNDMLIGSYNGETLDGGDGDDQLIGNGGYDDLYGGAGNDMLDGGSYGDNLRGGSGHDTIYGAGDADTIDGGSGDDTIYGDYSPLGSGNAISPSSNDENIFGGDGADIIYGDQGDDKIWSGQRDGDFGVQGTHDTGLEHDQLFGGEGNDTLAIGYGDDADGGLGTDAISIALAGATSGVVVDTSGFTPGGSWSLAGGTIQNIESISFILGSGHADTFNVGTHGFGVTIDAGAGNDVITSSGSSVIASGGSGNDRFISGVAGDILDGGAGVDTVDYQNASGSVTIDLSVGSGAGGDQLSGIENVGGSSFNDSLTGDSAANLLDGAAGNDILDGGAGADIMVGGSGDDQFVIDNAGDILQETEFGGNDVAVASANYTLGAGIYLETLQAAVAAGAINLTGNEISQTLTGNAAANVLDGGAGNDTIDGGNGFDTASYASAASGVSVTLALFGGQDTLGAGIDTLLNIENLTGSAHNDTLLGNAAANAISGGAGNDIIDGAAGADSMSGGLGDDRFYIDNSFDVVSEATGQGDDWAFVLGTYTLAQGASIETLVALNQGSTDPLVLTGNEYGQSLYGNLGDNYLNGGQGSDYLVGLAGNDNLLGGTGADHMAGGTGNDVYYVDQAGDLITELGGEGEDLLVATASYALGAGVSIETLSAEQGSAAINLTGNELAQSLYGNDGANILTGGGGADYMVGGLGNDKYFVDVSDYISESGGGGDDWIFVASSYTLREGNEIETLVALNQDSLDQVDFAGNEYGQSLYGSAGVNNLNGGAGNDYLVGLGGNDFLIGGEGNDNMAGGTGNDLYYADGGDAVFENTNEGDDLVVALQSFALGAGQSIETLSAAEGSANINLTGNELAQSLYGNAGNNLLNGGGGNDYLVGGAGGDRFVFTGAPGNDAVADFLSGTDKIDLSAYGITAAQVSASASGGNTLLSIDSNADGSADFTITLIGGGTPASGDYIF